MIRPTARKPDRADVAALLIVVACGALLHGWIAIHDSVTTAFSDSMDYMFMADFYRAALFGGDLEWARQYYAATRYPPVFPLLLALTGGSSAHQLAAAATSNVIAVLAAGATWAWIRTATGNRWLATASALALLAYPYHFVVNLSPVVEPLGILITSLVFALAARPTPAYSSLLVAALLVGISPLARTALLPLLIAFSLWLAIGRPQPWRRLLLPLALAWLPFLVWSGYREILGSQMYTGYLNAAQYAEAGIRWPEALWLQPARLFEAFAGTWGLKPSPVIWALSALITVLALAGAVIRLRRNCLDAWFLFGYLALIMLWPFPNELRRFLVAVYPCILLSAWTAALALDRLAAGSARGAWRGVMGRSLLAAALIAACVPAWSQFARRMAMPVDPLLLGDKREPNFFLIEGDEVAMTSLEVFARGRILLEQAHRTLPADACVYALPAQLGRLYARRNVLAYPLGLGSDEAAASRTLAKCDYFFLGAWMARLYGVPPLYPSEALRGWTEPVLTSHVGEGDRRHLAAALLKRRDAE